MTHRIVIHQGDITALAVDAIVIATDAGCACAQPAGGAERPDRRNAVRRALNVSQ